MSSSSHRRMSSKTATQIEMQNVRTPRSMVKSFLYCATVVFLSIMPLRNAAAQGLGIAVIGPTTTSMPYPCTTAGIQSAISDAVNLAHHITQSVVDASDCTNLSITSEIDVGTGTTDNKDRIKFIVPANGTWTANMTGGSSYALKWGDGAMIYGGTGSGEGQPFTIIAGNGSNLIAVCGNDPTNGTYFHAEGFTCSAGAGSTVQDAVVEIAGAQDESYVGHVTATVNRSASSVPRGLWIHNDCCSSTYEDINVEGENVSGVLPCVFGSFPGSADKNQGIHVSKISCVHPGNGQNAVLILQTGSTASPAQSIGNTFRDIYMEELLPSGSTQQDDTTPWVAVRQHDVAFPATDTLDGFRTYNDTLNSTRVVIDLGTGVSVNIMNLGLSDTSTRAIREPSGAVIYGAPNSVIAGYDMSSRFLGVSTINSLPTTYANPGEMFRVTDSTTITTEGQTCAGGGSTAALAFYNGSVWKCF